VVVPIVEGIGKGLDDKQISFLGTLQIRSLEKGLGLLSLITVIAPLWVSLERSPA